MCLAVEFSSKKFLMLSVDVKVYGKKQWRWQLLRFVGKKMARYFAAIFSAESSLLMMYER